MKTRLRFFIFLILPALMLGACGKDEVPTLEDRMGSQAQQDTEYEGVLESYKIEVYQRGTHQLRLKNDSIVYLQSSTIDLSDYLDEAVRVEGVMKEVVGSRAPVFNVVSIDYVDASAQFDWVEYENQSLGLMFDHPSTWIIHNTDDRVWFEFKEEQIAEIKAFRGESNLDQFAANQEGGESVEVTVGAQRALRYVSGSNLVFYVSNPAKKIIYRLEFLPSRSLIESGEAEFQESLFYDLLRGVELIYVAELEGEACGGEPFLECPESFICQLNDNSAFSEGICVSVDGPGSVNQCPFVAKPECSEYRISDYSARGCPTVYQCVDEGQDLEAHGTDYISEDEFSALSPEFIDEEVETDIEYEVPALSAVTQQFVSKNGGFSLNVPKTWYFVGFGPTDGSLWSMGFLNEEFEELDEALVVMNVEEGAGGTVSQKVGDVYYNFTGPSDLKAVMQAMADSVEEVEEEE